MEQHCKPGGPETAQRQTNEDKEGDQLVQRLMNPRPTDSAWRRVGRFDDLFAET